MKNYTTKVAKLLCLTFIFAALLAPYSMVAQQKRKSKKKKNNTEVASKPEEKKDKKKEKTIKELIKSSKEIDGLFKIYQDTITGSIQMLISENQIGKEFIYFSQVADGAIESGAFRGAYGESKVFKINKHFNKIEFVTQNTNFYFDPSNAISKSKDANNSEGNMASIKIEASDKKKGIYLIKANDLFLKETFAQIKPPKRPGTSPTAFSLGSLDKNKTKINAIRNYPENTDIAVEYVYSKSSTLNGGSNAIAGDGRNVSIKIYHSLIAMPDNDYEIRLDDPRVGYFLTQVDDKTSTNSTPYRDLIHRWNLKKKNPSAAISEPINPIVWWMENSTPVEWRETITEAVLRWNVAFEKAGFKNAMVVKMQPDDADWDAGDIRYNVLRWTASANPLFGGYGPSFVNPKTGEILGADVMLEYIHFTGRVIVGKMFDESSIETEFDIDNDQYTCSAGYLMNKSTLFGQAVISAFGDSDLELKKITYDNMMRLIMHEVGHTLGLNHNMKGSQLFTPEELATPEHIKGKALSTSVMEYPAINITRDRTKQGHYYDNAVGPYDEWAIQLGYTPFKSEQERDDLLNMSTQPELVFGNDADDMRSSSWGIDPRVNIYDLSDDAIRYAIDRIELVNTTMKNIKSKIVKDGESYEELRRAYSILQRERRISGIVISRYIGGVYLDRAMINQEGATQPYTPVSLEDQKRAMNAISKYIFAANAFDAPNDLYNYLARQRRGFDLGSGPEDPKIHKLVLSSQKSVLNHILHYNTLQRITDSELYGNKYSLSTFMTDLNNAIFKADIYGNVKSFRQNLQIEYTNMLINMLTGKMNSKYTNASKSMALYNLKRIRNMAAPSGSISSKAHKQHLRTLIDNAIKEIK